jgi:hypothetical protein
MLLMLRALGRITESGAPDEEMQQQRPNVRVHECVHTAHELGSISVCSPDDAWAEALFRDGGVLALQCLKYAVLALYYVYPSLQAYLPPQYFALFAAASSNSDSAICGVGMVPERYTDIMEVLCISPIIVVNGEGK